MDKRIVEKICSHPGPLVLVTIIGVDGSTPRHEGSSMLVDAQGLLSGTIGGGMGEHWAIAASQTCLQSGHSAILELDYTGLDAQGRVMICGGSSRALLELIVDKQPYQAALAGFSQKQPDILVKKWLPPQDFGPWPPQPVDGWTVGRLSEITSLTVECSQQSSPISAISTKSTAVQQFIDPLHAAVRLVILGAGHCGQALAWAASRLDFQIVVGDDRPGFLKDQAFPPGTRVASGTYTKIIQDLYPGPADYVVLVSRGHLCDLECLRGMLPHTVAYLGLIGSTRKIQLLYDQVRQDGFSEAQLERVHAPIGLEIGAETPAEIAISILAQIIAIQHRTESVSL